MVALNWRSFTSNSIDTTGYTVVNSAYVGANGRISCFDSCENATKVYKLLKNDLSELTFSSNVIFHSSSSSNSSSSSSSSSTNAYSYYRLEITGTGTTGTYQGLVVNEIEGYAGETNVFLSSNGTVCTSTGGYNGTPGYTGDGGPGYAIDGESSDSSSGTYTAIGKLVGQYFQFALTSPQAVDTVKVYYTTGTWHTLVTVKASNDGVNWVDVSQETEIAAGSRPTVISCIPACQLFKIDWTNCVGTTGTTYTYAHTIAVTASNQYSQNCNPGKLLIIDGVLTDSQSMTEYEFVISTVSSLPEGAFLYDWGVNTGCIPQSSSSSSEYTGEGYYYIQTSDIYGMVAAGNYTQVPGAEAYYDGMQLQTGGGHPYFTTAGGNSKLIWSAQYAMWIVLGYYEPSQSYYTFYLGANTNTLPLTGVYAFEYDPSTTVLLEYMPGTSSSSSSSSESSSSSSSESCGAMPATYIVGADDYGFIAPETFTLRESFKVFDGGAVVSGGTRYYYQHPLDYNNYVIWDSSLGKWIVLGWDFSNGGWYRYIHNNQPNDGCTPISTYQYSNYHYELIGNPSSDLDIVEGV